jgi:hypothetical protein
MTVETRTTIEFRDILRAEFECPKCKTRIGIEITDNNVIPSRCKNGMCDQVFLGDGSSEHKYLVGALDLIGRYVNKSSESFTLRLEIKQSNSQTSTDRQ